MREVDKVLHNKKGVLEIQVKARKDAILKGLDESYGVVTTACEKAGVSRQTFYKYFDEDSEFRAKAEEMQEIALDFVESKLFEKIKSGDIIAILFYLKTKGKKRGYVEKLEADFGAFRNRVIKVGYGLPLDANPKSFKIGHGVEENFPLKINVVMQEDD